MSAQIFQIRSLYYEIEVALIGKLHERAVEIFFAEIASVVRIGEEVWIFELSRFYNPQIDFLRSEQNFLTNERSEDG